MIKYKGHDMPTYLDEAQKLLQKEYKNSHLYHASKGPVMNKIEEVFIH